MDKVIFPTITHTNSRRWARANKIKLLYFIYSNIYYRFYTYMHHIFLKCRFDMLCKDILAHIRDTVWYWIPKNLVYSKIVCDYKIRARLYDYGLKFHCGDDNFARLYSSSMRKVFNFHWCDAVIIIQILFVNEKLNISYTRLVFCVF